MRVAGLAAVCASALLSGLAVAFGCAHHELEDYQTLCVDTCLARIECGLWNFPEQNCPAFCPAEKAAGCEREGAELLECERDRFACRDWTRDWAQRDSQGNPPSDDPCARRREAWNDCTESG
jgi:hypothetical protein